ncbi:MAG: antibiotic biosynthesis monooxygenase [Coriobacteriia bacterium]|jgi:quinol monooxygenase YgiN|nr:antibiotic biosynthesis monooxygenase [Coriobacteriia bacterium]MDR2714638.1 antibiotic biosynthesis monooxygenase [Coriobacteriales bacterium]
MVVVLAHIEVKEGAVPGLIEAADKCAELTRQEAGCIFYTLYASTEDPQNFVFVEEWESKELLDAHLASEHLNAFVAEIENLLASPLDIKIYEANQV